MTRDPELIRQLMLKLEEVEPKNGSGTIVMTDVGTDLLVEGYSADQVAYHYRLILDTNWIEGGPKRFQRITNQGHDFLDSVRDDEIWSSTKNGALKAKGFTLELLGDLAKGFVRKKLESLTGVEL